MENPGHGIGDRGNNQEQCDAIQCSKPAHAFKLAEVGYDADADKGQHEHHFSHRALYYASSIRGVLNRLWKINGDADIEKPGDEIANDKFRETEPYLGKLNTDLSRPLFYLVYPNQGEQEGPDSNKNIYPYLGEYGSTQDPAFLPMFTCFL